MGRGAGAPGAAPGAGRGMPQVYQGSYPNSLVNEIVPFIEKNFRAIPKKDSRAIAGLSMGGGHTTMATGTTTRACSGGSGFGCRWPGH